MRKRPHGFVAIASLVLAVGIIVTAASIYQLLQNSVRNAVVMSQNDRSSLIADVGLQESINLVRANPDLDRPYGDYYNPALTVGGYYLIYASKAVMDAQGKTIGYYDSRVKKVIWPGVFKDQTQTPITGEVHHLISFGHAMKKNGGHETGATAHAYVYIPTIGKYFAAVKGGLMLGAGSNLANAEVYGGTLNFVNLVSVPSTPGQVILKGADYATSITNPDPWPISPDPLFGAIVIDGNPTNHPNQLPSPLIFPGMDEQFNYYSNSGATPNCNFRVNDLYPPSYEKLSNGFPPGAPVVNLGSRNKNDHSYYCNGTATIGKPGQTLTIHGQVIIAARTGVVINGNIAMSQPTRSASKLNGYVAPDSGPSYTLGAQVSTADQLVLYSGTDVVIANTGAENWCNNAVGVNKLLSLQGVMVVASGGSIQATTNPPCSEANRYSINFQGAMFLNTQPQFLTVFKLARTYSYLETLRTDPPPTREFYQVLRYFVFRQNLGIAAPLASGTP